MFFIGYFLFEVPSNLSSIASAQRLWIGRIMITWGLVSASFMFIRTPASFYILRFILGIAEAGFFPGIILYLTYWYPERATGADGGAVHGRAAAGRRLRRTAVRMDHAVVRGQERLAGWQWLFLLEAIPALIVGIAVLFYLDNGIRIARNG